MPRLNPVIPILAVLLMLVFLPEVSFCTKGKTASLEALPISASQECQLAPDTDGFSLTWTSNWNSEPQLVHSDTTIIGDHIVLNATFDNDILGINVSSSELVMIDVFGGTFNANASGNCIILDTYYLNKINNTYEIVVIGYASENESIVFTRNTIILCNFFAPQLAVHSPLELPEDSLTLNISWSCKDLNAEEMNFFEVWLSNDGGMSYWPLARNLTEYWSIWNSTGFLETTYLFRIRAYSHDISPLRFYPLVHISSDYWPADFSDGIVQHKAGNVHTGGPPPFPSISLSHPDDVHYFAGTIGHEIVWEVSCTESVQYSVVRNNTILFTDTWYEGPIIVSIAGLPVGVYQYRLLIAYYAEDSVLVFVEPNSSILLLVISCSSTTVFLVSITLFLRKKRHVKAVDQ